MGQNIVVHRSEKKFVIEGCKIEETNQVQRKGPFLAFSSQSELFSKSRESSDLAQSNSTYISQQLLLFSELEFSHLGGTNFRTRGGMIRNRPIRAPPSQYLILKAFGWIIYIKDFLGIWR
ncbi:hypothetical protein FRX31_033592 [Thalictrum thalictroides]|uniref:Uncharacterized protein n=1 Tax=Thalictrum thalictroides TaxID=46969 RepID=A0A7J6UWF4_THATH|nr:hypothetical protein FRX31_033592 [Thalictrum thalictroides]